MTFKRNTYTTNSCLALRPHIRFMRQRKLQYYQHSFPKAFWQDSRHLLNADSLTNLTPLQAAVRKAPACLQTCSLRISWADLPLIHFRRRSTCPTTICKDNMVRKSPHTTTIHVLQAQQISSYIFIIVVEYVFTGYKSNCEIKHVPLAFQQVSR